MYLAVHWSTTLLNYSWVECKTANLQMDHLVKTHQWINMLPKTVRILKNKNNCPFLRNIHLLKEWTRKMYTVVNSIRKIYVNYIFLIHVQKLTNRTRLLTLIAHFRNSLLHLTGTRVVEDRANFTPHMFVQSTQRDCTTQVSVSTQY